MPKASIITLHYIKNYGSVLQTYSTQKKFELMGFETQVIDYIRPNAAENAMLKDGIDQKGYSGNPLKSTAYAVLKRIENIRRDKVFQNFLDKYVHLTRKYMDYDDLKRNPPESDVYVTGSDQTWNSEYNNGVLPAYYLDFVPEGKLRIGYSVSIGMDEIPPSEREETAGHIGKYQAVSVREASAERIIRALGYTNVRHILDPTLVLDQKDWAPIIAPRMIGERYIIIYRLNPNPTMEAYARRLAEKTGCKIVRMSYYLVHCLEQGKMIYTPTVEQFLSLINYAEYVITDSFHCTAFSINFHKAFFVFYPGKYNTRIQSVLELTGAQDRVVTNTDQVIGQIDFDQVERVLGRERRKATAFIEEMVCEKLRVKAFMD